MAFTLEDDNGRTLLVVNDNGQFAFSRFPDMNIQTKTELIEIYKELSGTISNEFLDFLDFRNNTEQFCS